MTEKQQPEQSSDVWEGYYDWDTSTQIGIGAGIVSAPIALGLAEMLGMGISGFVIAAAIGGGGFLAGKAISERQLAKQGDEQQRGLIDKIKHANWKALLIETPEAEPVQEASPAQAAAAEDVEDAWDERWYDDGDDVELPTSESGLFTFSQLLAAGFKPKLSKIFLGRLGDGTDIFVEARELCHVALAGNTGGGKSSLMRLVMAQLCAVGVKVLLLNPHYMVYDREHGEDWTPFTPYLERDPVECSKFETIHYYLKWIVEKTLQKRIERAQRGEAIGKPYFVIIDELPALIAERKECSGYIAKILREGRKYGIFLIVASQDFLVKTTGMEGGAVRKCFRTACYVGGDETTARVLLEQGLQIPETDLGKGTMMLRCSATKKTVIAKTPYVDNEALYRLLGPSTFRVLPTTRPEIESARVSEEGNGEMPGNVLGNALEMALQANAETVMQQVFSVSSAPEIAASASTESESLAVSAEILETIRRMKESTHFGDAEIAKLTGLAGRKYKHYQAALTRLGYK